MAWYNGTLHLASEAGQPIGLHIYNEGQFARVETGLTPEIEDIHTVDTANGILWTVGMKEITRFDGHRWDRIDFPGNDPIR